MFELKFSPKIINHLGLNMYSTLPPVLIELITNAYDADASLVTITVDQAKKSIEILDNRHGMTFKELNDNFLQAGKNRRTSKKDTSPNGRKVTGKKGIGKFSVFGICEEIHVESCKNNKINSFKMNYKELMAHDENKKITLYPILDNKDTNDKSYTKIILKNLTRKSTVPIQDTANSILTRLKIFDEMFKCILKDETNECELTSETRNKLIIKDKEYEWEIPALFNTLNIDKPTQIYINENKITGKIISTKEPIKGEFKGVSLYARGKLANEPEFYGAENHSYAMSYMNGEIFIDFIDENNSDDYISTSRNSLIWDKEEPRILKIHLEHIIKKIAQDWQKKKKEKKLQDLEKIHGINTKWFETKIQSSHDKKLAKKITDLIISSDLDTTKTRDLLNYVEGAFEFEVFKDYASDIESSDSPEKLLKLLQDWEVVEAKEHYRLATGRVKTINKFNTLITDDTLEVGGLDSMHEFLKKFPWLLEPRLTSLTDEVTYSQFLKEEFNDYSLNEKDRRIDFICKGTNETLYVMEIKRSQKKIGIKELDQLKSYQRFIKRKLTENDRNYTEVKAYIIGKEAVGSSEVQDEISEAKEHGRYVLNYSQMLSQAKKYHEEFIESYEKTNNLNHIKTNQKKENLS